MIKDSLYTNTPYYRELIEKEKSLTLEVNGLGNEFQRITNEFATKKALLELYQVEISRIDEAEEQIYAKLVQDKLANEGPYFDFGGDSSCNDGEGNCNWDGIDGNRCCCGNRRVTWVLSEDRTAVSAEAY